MIIGSQRILTAELEWKQAKDISLGERILAFDELPTELGSCGKGRRRLRPGEITRIYSSKSRVYSLTMSDGSTVAAAGEHPWLIASKVSRNQAWMSTYDLCTALIKKHKRRMHKFMEPWEPNTSRDGGWLAGLYDGEGHFSHANRKGVVAGVAQKPGIVLEKAKRIHESLGFIYGVSENRGSGVTTLLVEGGWREIMRVLGTLRPHRLISKFTEALASGALKKQMGCKDDPIEIVDAKYIGEEEVVCFDTNTRTYFCEGYAAHQ